MIKPERWYLTKLGFLAGSLQMEFKGPSLQVLHAKLWIFRGKESIAFAKRVIEAMKFRNLKENRQ